MINQKSIVAVENANLCNNLKKPLVDTYCFANIPNTILSLFGLGKKGLPKDCTNNEVKTYKKVILFLLDGFGYDFFEKFAEKSLFLREAMNKGVVSKLTTQFPTTTTANITTINTNLPVGKSGIYEWFIYEPKLDRIYCPLLYKYPDGKNIIKPSKSLLPKNHFYTKLKKNNISTYIFQYELFNKGEYSKAVSKPCTKINFENINEGLEKLKTALRNQGSGYYYFYIPEIDGKVHDFGTESIEADTEILNVLTEIDNFYLNLKLEDTVILLTADHGLADVNKETAFFINKDLPEILPMLKKNRNNAYIVPCGSYRDFFLHINKKDITKAYELLKSRLANIASVYTIKELIKLGIFGKTKKRTIKKMGDIVILPFKSKAVWWYEENLFYIKHKGMHGGLVKEELEIPFIYLPLTYTL